MIKASVIVFPGSNCDRDVKVAIERITGFAPAMVSRGRERAGVGPDRAAGRFFLWRLPALGRWRRTRRS